MVTSAQEYLMSSAKWEKFMAIVQIVLLSLGVLGLIFGGTTLISFMQMGRGFGGVNSPYDSSVFLGVFIFYALLLAVFIIPNVYRLLYAQKCIKALNEKDNEMLTVAFKNLKTYSTFWGILTIIFIALYLLFFVIAIFAMAMGR